VSVISAALYIIKVDRRHCNHMSDKTSETANKLVEWRYQLRIEHNHADMKWYAYYAGKDQRRLFDRVIDRETAGDTPLEAVTALNDLVSKHPDWRYKRF
jgi:hypothetical protein